MANIAALKVASEVQALHHKTRFPSLPLPAIKSLFENGLPRGIVAEINGRRSSGRTSLSLHVLAQATARHEVCAVVDLQDNFHPASAVLAGVQLEQLVWVRCQGNAEHAIRATDLLLHAGGFGVIVLDLCEANARLLNRIPLSYWYRFRRALEHTPTILLVCAESAQAKASSLNRLQLKAKGFHWAGRAPSLLLRGLETTVGTSAFHSQAGLHVRVCVSSRLSN